MVPRRSPRKAGSISSQAIPCLVTGGAGFLGRHLVEALLAEGRYSVSVFDLREPIEPVKGVHYITGDLRKLADVKTACEDQDVVFHVATAAPTGNNAYNEALMVAVNIDGTNNVVAACIASGVKALIYTSSASVVFEGKDLVDVDESIEYARKPIDFYTHTKIEGEKIVLQANGASGLHTLALRPSGIFGEYDLLTLPTIIKKAKGGKMKYIVGDGTNRMDWTYAGNVATAHLRAAEMLMDKPSIVSRVAGRPFFITNDDPRGFWEFMKDVCDGLGYDGPRIKLPFWLVFMIACFVSYIVVPIVALFGKTLETDMTPFRALVASTNRVFSCEAAKKELGYKPMISYEDAIKRTLKYFSHEKAGKVPSKGMKSM